MPFGLGRKNSTTKTKCPCGKFASTPGKHDGPCAWQESKNRHPSSMGASSFQGPTGPKGPKPTSGTPAQTLSVDDTYGRTMTLMDNAPSGPQAPKSTVTSSDGRNYLSSPLPPENQLTTENSSAFKGADPFNLGVFQNPYEMHKKVNASSDFVPEHGELLGNPATSKTTHDAMWEKFQSNLLYQEKAASSKYTPEYILERISTAPANVGVSRRLAENPYISDATLKSLTRSSDPQTRQNAESNQKKRSAYRNKPGMPTEMAYYSQGRDARTNMYRTLTF